MTIINRNAPLSLTALEHTPPCALDVCWTAMVTQWCDRFNLLGKQQRHGRLTFTVQLRCDDCNADSWTLSAQLTLGRRTRNVLSPTPALCSVTHDRELLHFDICLADDAQQRVLALSCRGRQLLFAQSALLQQAGLTAGRYDPPQLTCSAATVAAMQRTAS